MALPTAWAEPSGGEPLLKTGGSYIMPIYIIRKMMELHPELAARVLELLVVLLC